MKKIGRIVLHNNAELLDTPEMKMIRGGYSDGGGGYDANYVCVYSTELFPDRYICYVNAEQAQTNAGAKGWWACSETALKEKCKLQSSV